MKQSKYLLIAIAIMMLVMLILDKIGTYQESNLSVNGVVQKVSYDQNKGTPTITVNNINYKLYGHIDFKYKIEIGDMISKKKGTVIYQLTKKDRGEKIIFGD